MHRGSILAGYAPISRVTFIRRSYPAKCAKEIEILSEIFKSMWKSKTRVFSGRELIKLRDPVDYHFVLKFSLQKVMPEPNVFNVSRFQRNNAVKNSKCMASQSIENFWWFENIVFRVLIFQSILPFKESQDIWLTYKCSQPIRMFPLQFAWKKLQPPLSVFPQWPNAQRFRDIV